MFAPAEKNCDQIEVELSGHCKSSAQAVTPGLLTGFLSFVLPGVTLLASL